MDSNAPDPGAGVRRQYVLLAGLFAAVLAVLALGYFLFLRPEYVVLAQDLRPADASAIVAELDKGGKPYRLRDGGTTILVPADQADATRVAMAGSSAAARGQIGFELFNKSDMGLTNFAQKINYQRALQGELVRTISEMDGVESARVHLALPEKTLFRGDRVEPKAAVTLTMKPGQTADPARVAGIQRLVAAAVPDLPEAKVVILDAAGRAISAAPAMATPDTGGPADVEERGAIEDYYHARARGAVEQQLSGFRFTLRVLLLAAAQRAGASAPGDGGWAPAEAGSGRNFGLRMVFISETALNPEDQQRVRDAVFRAAGMDAALGDSLTFETGPLDLARPAAQPVPVPIQAPVAAAPQPPASSLAWPPLWLWLVAAVAIGALFFWRLRSGPAQFSDAERQAFAERLRRQLAMSDEQSDAAA